MRIYSQSLQIVWPKHRCHGSPPLTQMQSSMGKHCCLLMPCHPTSCLRSDQTIQAPTSEWSALAVNVSAGFEARDIPSPARRRQGSNLRASACEAESLPLSYGSSSALNACAQCHSERKEGRKEEACSCMRAECLSQKLGIHWVSSHNVWH